MVRQVMARPRQEEVTRGKNKAECKIVDKIRMTTVALEVEAEATMYHAGVGTLMDGTII